MQKSLFALAVAALCSTNALAQTTNVTIYGLADAGLVSESGGPNGRVTAVSSGIASGSRLGFKGKEDLGNGLAAVFTLESGVSLDTGASGQGGLTFGRQAFVGLTGKFGAVTLGRQYSPYYKVLRDIGDAFGAVSMAGRAGNLMATNTRTDNMVEYVSPVVGGLRADLAYGAGETAGDSAKNRMLGGSLAYTAGRLTVAGGYHRIDNATATDAATNTLLSGNYKFDLLTTYLSVAKTKGTGTTDSRDVVAGVAVPIGAGKLLVSHVRHDDRTLPNKDAHQWGIGYVYKMSKRTDLYTAYAVISNENGATYKVGNATDKGSGDRAFNLGMRHSF